LLCVVGNKDDNDRKVVPPSDARRLADQVGIPFFETSAKENKNVEEVGVCGVGVCALDIVTMTLHYMWQRSLFLLDNVMHHHYSVMMIQTE